VPVPEKMRPLRYKTTMRLAFEDAFVKAGLVTPEQAATAGGGGTVTTATWLGTRAAA
jgi:hypothetical protein